MPIQAQSADGAIHEFPDGTEPGVIDNAMKQYASQPKAQEKPDESTWTQRLLRGAKDTVEGIGQLGGHAPDWLNGPRRAVTQDGKTVFLSPEETTAARDAERTAFDAKIAQGEKDYQGTRGANAGTFDPMRLVGNVATTAPLAALVPGGAATTIPRMMLNGAATGALTGATQPVTEGNFADEKLKQIGVGAGLGGVTSGLIGAGSRVISPNVSPEVRQLIDKRVYPPPGQIIGGAAKRAEDMVGIGSRSGVAGEYTLAAINDALAPLGVKLPKGIAPGQAAVSEANNIVSKAYDDVWSSAHRVALDKPAADELTGIIEQATQKFKNPEHLDQFKGLVEDGLASVKGAVTADKVKAAVDGLRETAADYIRAGGPQATMGRLLNRIADTTEEAAVRSNPALAAAKAAADKAYAGMAGIIAPASAKDVAEGLITPRSLAAAVKSGAPSDRMVATGQGLLQPLAAAGLKALPPAVNSAAPYAIGAGIGGAGVGASALTGDPKYAAGAGALGLLYTPAGRRMFAKAMTERPEYFKAIAESLRSTSPYAATIPGAAQ